mmetsp:Transcript_19600/g.61569  ORF Transcript_19600/g.61569 Transcript_19600/m.61569 type:complete len:242 (+) Transcript_19600:2124-2849(+)
MRCRWRSSTAPPPSARRCSRRCFRACSPSPPPSTAPTWPRLCSRSPPPSVWSPWPSPSSAPPPRRPTPSASSWSTRLETMCCRRCSSGWLTRSAARQPSPRSAPPPPQATSAGRCCRDSERPMASRRDEPRRATVSAWSRPHVRDEMHQGSRVSRPSHTARWSDPQDDSPPAPLSIRNIFLFFSTGLSPHSPGMCCLYHRFVRGALLGRGVAEARQGICTRTARVACIGAAQFHVAAVTVR